MEIHKRHLLSYLKYLARSKGEAYLLLLETKKGRDIEMQILTKQKIVCCYVPDNMENNLVKREHSKTFPLHLKTQSIQDLLFLERNDYMQRKNSSKLSRPRREKTGKLTKDNKNKVFIFAQQIAMLFKM